ARAEPDRGLPPRHAGLRAAGGAGARHEGRGLDRVRRRARRRGDGEDLQEAGFRASAFLCARRGPSALRRAGRAGRGVEPRRGGLRAAHRRAGARLRQDLRRQMDGGAGPARGRRLCRGLRAGRRGARRRHVLAGGGAQRARGARAADRARRLSRRPRQRCADRRQAAPDPDPLRSAARRHAASALSSVGRAGPDQMTLNRSFLFAPGNVARRVENAPSSEFCYRDLVETLHRKVDGVVVPKIESAADLHAIDWLMASLEREFGVEPGTLDLMPQIETAAGVQRVDRILQARSLRPYTGPWRVKRVAFGGADYAHQLGLIPDFDETQLADARARVVLSSRAAGMEGPIDSPWFHFRESEGFARSLERSRRGGFQGRLCVHPDERAPVNAAYLPSDAELARAERIVAAFKQAEAAG